MNSRQTGSRAIKCSVCEATFAQWEGFFKHVNSTHSDTHVTCAWCGLFFTGNTLRRHMMHTHASDNKKTKTRQPNGRKAEDVQMASYQQARRMTDRSNNVVTPSSNGPSRGEELICEHCLGFTHSDHSIMARHYKDMHGADFVVPARARRSNQSESRNHRHRGGPTSTTADTTVAAAALLSMSQGNNTGAQQRPPQNSHGRSLRSSQARGESYVTMCPNCDAYNAIDTNATWIVCHECKRRFTCDTDRLETVEQVRRRKKLEQENTDDNHLDISSIAPYCETSLADLLTKEEQEELREFEERLNGKSSDYLQNFVLDMVQQAIRNRRSAEDMDDKLMSTQQNCNILEEKINGMKERLDRAENEREQYKNMAVRLHHQNKQLKMRLGSKRPLENPEEGAPAAKKPKLEGDFPSSNGTTEAQGLKSTVDTKPDSDDGKGDEDVKMVETDERAVIPALLTHEEQDTEMKEASPSHDGVMNGVNGEATAGHESVEPSPPLDPARKESYERDGKKAMDQWLRQARNVITKLMSNPKANALQTAPIDGDGMILEGHMDLQQLNKNFRKKSSIWEVEKDLKKLWNTAQFISAHGSMSEEHVRSLQLETQYNLAKITGETKDWDVNVIGKFFESLDLPEFDVVLKNILTKNIDGASLLKMENVEEFEKELGLSKLSAELLDKAVKRCNEEVTPILHWNES